jgi:hypothetical protein
MNINVKYEYKCYMFVLEKNQLNYYKIIICNMVQLIHLYGRKSFIVSILEKINVYVINKKKLSIYSIYFFNVSYLCIA